MAARRPRILILSASIGEGHDLPARVLAEDIAAEEPDAETEIVDYLEIVNPLVRRIVMSGSQFHSAWGLRVFDLEFRLISEFRPTIWITKRFLWVFGRRRLSAAIERVDPDVVVSTYPGATEVLGELRRRGHLSVPVVAAITDLAALRYWAHAGVDLHLITHPESAEEVRSLAPASAIEAVRGLSDAAFYEPRDSGEARQALGLPEEGPLIAISGGGWGVGDLAGATEIALAEDGATAVCLCGRNEDVREALSTDFAGEPRVVVLGFTERMPDLLGASDVLVHSTAGLTVLEAIISGCRVISYGWGHGHIRVNNKAYARFGLARVAADREQLRAAIRDSLAERGVRDPSFAALPTAASRVLAEAQRR